MNILRSLSLPIVVIFVSTSLWVVHAWLLDKIMKSDQNASWSSSSPTIETTWDPDHDGINSFSQAYNNNEQQIKRLLAPGFDDFYKKLSNALLTDPSFVELLDNCDNCEYLLKPGLDDVVREYVQRNFEIMTNEGNNNAFEVDLWTMIVADYLEIGIEALNQRQFVFIWDRSEDMVRTITEQIQWNNDAFEAFWATWLDSDGVTWASFNSTQSDILSQLGMIWAFLAVSQWSVWRTNQPNDDLTLAITDIFRRIICNPASESEWYINFFHNNWSQQENPYYEWRGRDTWSLAQWPKDSIVVEYLKNSAAIRGDFYNTYCSWKRTIETLNRDFLHYAKAELQKKHLQCNRWVPQHLFEPQAAQVEMWTDDFPNTATWAIAQITTQPAKRLAWSYYNTTQDQRRTIGEQMKETLRTARSIAQSHGITDFPWNASFVISQWDIFGDLNLSHTGNIAATNDRFWENIWEQQAIQASQPAFSIITEEIARSERNHLKAQYDEIESFAISQLKWALEREQTLRYLSSKPECG